MSEAKRIALGLFVCSFRSQSSRIFGGGAATHGVLRLASVLALAGLPPVPFPNPHASHCIVAKVFVVSPGPAMMPLMESTRQIPRKMCGSG